MIEARELRKKYGDKVAVDGLSFSVRPGVVTGFLGPNGAGKSTTMRMILGLDHPTSGEVTVNGRPYARHPAPLAEVGALLEAKAIHTSRTAYNHLRTLAATHGIGRQRIDEVLELVGLTEVARKRAGGFSLGMGQRLGIASALLADPSTVLLDEPVNGLDPEGIRWVRDLLQGLARQGRTVFVSSHLMSEMALTAEQVIVVGKGRLIADVSVAELVRGASSGMVVVRSPEAARLRAALEASGATSVAASTIARPDGSGFDDDRNRLEVVGLNAARIGEVAAAGGIVLHELTPQQASLEEAYMAMTQDAVEYHAAPPPGATGAVPGRDAA